MQSAEIDNLVPITREVLREYYKQFPVIEPSEELKELSVKLKKLCEDGGLILKADGEGDPELKEIQYKFLVVPRKLDENMWRVREQLEDILYLQEPDNLKPVEDVVKGLDSIKLDDWQSALKEIKQGCQEAFESIDGFQKGGMKKVQTLISTFLPNDFRISIVKAQQERSEANREAQIKALIESGGTIREKYDLYWELQLQRRQTLVNIGNATGAFKMILKYIGGVPQVLLDFIKTVNDNEGPMDELRQTYGPQMYFYAELINVICMYLWLVSVTLRAEKQTERRKAIEEGLGENMKVVQSAISLFKVEIIRYLEQQLKILEGSPFFVSKNEAGGDDSTTEFKETVVAKEFVARVKARPQDTVVVAFNTVGKDIGFAVTFESKSGENKKTVREYERVNSHAKEVADQFVGEEDGFFLFRWDNSYSWLSSKTLNYKVYNKTLVDAATSASSSSQDGGEEDAAAFEDLVKAADGEKDK